MFFTNAWWKKKAKNFRSDPTKADQLYKKAIAAYELAIEQGDQRAKTCLATLFMKGPKKELIN